MKEAFVTLEPGLLSTIDAASFDSAGKRLALGGWGHGRVLDLETRATLWEGELLGAGLDPEDLGVMRVVALSPTGRYAFFGGDGHTGGSGSYGYFLVDIATSSSRELYENPPAACTAATFSRDEEQLYALSDGALHVFDLGANRRTIELPAEGASGVDSVALLAISDSQLVVAAGEALFEVSLATGHVAVLDAGGARFAHLGAALPGPSALLTTQSRGSANRLVRYEGRALRALFETRHTIVWVSPAGDQVFLAGEDDEGTSALLRRRLGATKATRIRLPDDLLDELEGRPWCFAVSPDGQRALLARDRYETDEVFLVRLPAGRG